jgi:hypothetical protein
MRTILIAPAVIALGAFGFMAMGQAGAQPRVPPGMMQERTPQGTFGFFAASQPANSNRVGIFVARRLPNEASPELFYCSSPADAASKDPAACKKIDALPK